MVDFPAPGMPVRQTISFTNSETTKCLVYEATGNYYKDYFKKFVMRIFVAIEIFDKDVINSITKVQSNLDIKAKPVAPENLHFTLQFLGEVSKEKVVEIKTVLKKIEFSSFNINFKGIGVFPKMKFPRVVWIGTDEVGGDSLKDLAKKVENSLNPLGFKPDKPFRSHITIMRIKSKVGDISEKLEKFQNYDFGSQKISCLKLKMSTLTPQGPEYSDLEEVNAQ